jgi:riboflavin synthase alpha subunit
MKVVNVITGTNVTKNQPVQVPSDTTLRAVLEAAQIEYQRGGITIDGVSLQPGDIDKTFDDFNVANTTWLLQVKKADNANF